MVAKFRRASLRGAIVGPHGSGKSTLLEHIAPQIGSVIFRRDGEGNASQRERTRAPSDHPIVWLQLRKCEPKTMSIPWPQLVAKDVLLLDGYEQLSPPQRIWVVWRTRVRKVGLLVTSHQRTLLPTICQLRLTSKLAHQIVTRLLDTQPKIIKDFNIPSDHEIAEQLRSNGGNMRELLMDLYDRFEQR